MKEATKCVGILVPVRRWQNDRYHNRMIFWVPVIIWLYNVFMNGEDIVDQRIQLNVTNRKKRLSTLIYTHVLDVSMNNAYALYLWFLIFLMITEQN